MTLNTGDRAPEFLLNDSEGKQVSLKDYAGKTIILYFYPKDSTPGCTREACDFRDSFERLKTADAVVVGISADSVESHRKFSSKYELPFTLLSDPEHKVLEAYGVWKQKNMMGRKFMGIERSTFIIDAQGKISAVYNKVKVNGHVDEILDFLKRQ
ncbi:MAG: thioredoxin-dependent thiol peroxidase [Bacteroidota bacterium]